MLQKLKCECGDLKLMRCLTGSQCKVWSASDERVWLGSTSLAKVFWILCSLLRLACEVPNNSELA